LYILHHQLSRRNLSDEAASYLRGQRYLAEKQQHGGDRRSDQSRIQPDHLRTRDRLAAEFDVSPATIHRDGKFASAVDTLVETCGQQARTVILARDGGLRRGGVEALARRDADEQRAFFAAWRKTGKRPRQAGAAARWLRVPAELQPLAACLLKRFGHAGYDALLRHMAAALAQADPNLEGSSR
jgi:hypothetical protein